MSIDPKILDNPFFGAAAETVWQQFRNVHHALRDVDTAQQDGYPVGILNQVRDHRERAYHGGLDVFFRVAKLAGLDTTVQHPDNEHLRVFSLRHTQHALLEWARATNQEFPANFDETSVILPS